MDFIKPNTDIGMLSAKSYIQGDCKKFRNKVLSFSSYKKPMGGGIGSPIESTPDKDWKYPHPDSLPETILKSVCQHTRWKQF